LTKWLGYSTVCSLLAIGAVTLIVLLF